MEIQEWFYLGMDRRIPKLLDFKEGTILNVGAGNKNIAGSLAIDYPEYDADRDSLPFKDNSIAGIHCYHFLEHINDPVSVLQDFQRVLMDDGVVNILVPYYKAQMQFQDLDHRHFFCEETWRVLFSNSYYDKNRINWKFKIHSVFILGLVERNLGLFTQLVKHNG